MREIRSYGSVGASGRKAGLLRKDDADWPDGVLPMAGARLMRRTSADVLACAVVQECPIVG